MSGHGSIVVEQIEFEICLDPFLVSLLAVGNLLGIIIKQAKACLRRTCVRILNYGSGIVDFLFLELLYNGLFLGLLYNGLFLGLFYNDIFLGLFIRLLKDDLLLFLDCFIACNDLFNLIINLIFFLDFNDLFGLIIVLIFFLDFNNFLLGLFLGLFLAT